MKRIPKCFYLKKSRVSASIHPADFTSLSVICSLLSGRFVEIDDVQCILYGLFGVYIRLFSLLHKPLT